MLGLIPSIAGKSAMCACNSCKFCNWSPRNCCLLENSPLSYSSLWLIFADFRSGPPNSVLGVAEANVFGPHELPSFLQRSQTSLGSSKWHWTHQSRQLRGELFFLTVGICCILECLCCQIYCCPSLTVLQPLMEDSLLKVVGREKAQDRCFYSVQQRLE